MDDGRTKFYSRIVIEKLTANPAEVAYEKISLFLFFSDGDILAQIKSAEQTITPEHPMIETDSGFST